MYNPAAFAKTDPGTLKAFIAGHPFATLVTGAGEEPKVSHIPMYCVEEAGADYLVGHLARANDHWRSLDGAGRKSTAVFHGPHAYISAAWYGTRNVVPTWNYVAVHVTGTLRTVGDGELADMLDMMIRRHEGDAGAFARNLDDQVRDALSKQIVGVKLAVDRMDGKWKLSQNKDAEARQRIVAELRAAGDEGSRRIAEWMAEGAGPGPTPPHR